MTVLFRGDEVVSRTGRISNADATYLMVWAWFAGMGIFTLLVWGAYQWGAREIVEDCKSLGGFHHYGIVYECVVIGGE